MKSYYVLGQAASKGEMIRCNDRDIAEHELGQMRFSKCSRLAITTRPATETEALAWFPAGVTVVQRESRHNAVTTDRLFATKITARWKSEPKSALDRFFILVEGACVKVYEDFLDIDEGREITDQVDLTFE